ncbi:MAG: ribosomal RNA small subunit methyltransferase A [Thermoleophilaceae bacterium]|nr:ribosomal RNA small subunit methyltransferase A [Thermoleophilaceae bacterium]
MSGDEHYSSPTQPSIERMLRFDIQPRRKLGQNFLIDNNILEVIGDASGLGPGDVVLEVGGGLGVLSEFLAERAKHVHVIEIDESLRPPLEDAIGDTPNVSLVFADAVKIDYGALDPRPNKLIANLPYNVAATCVIKSFYELPELELCCVMSQREVGDRLTAKPGGKLYAGTSVLVQAVCGETATRKLSRNIFHPVPNVDSSLVTLKRTEPNPPEGFNDLVHGAFAHRRKPLASSLAHANRDDKSIRERAAAALAEIGLAANTRAEQLTAAQFRQLQPLIGPAA